MARGGRYGTREMGKINIGINVGEWACQFQWAQPLNLPREHGYCRVEWQGERFARSQLL